MAPARRKLIVVSNRGPVGYRRSEDGSRTAQRGGGGLVTALRPLVSHHDVTWIAAAMTDEDRVVAAETGDSAFGETGRDGSPYRLRLVSHDRDEFDRYYNVFANPTLWFLQHYLWDLAHAPSLGPDLHAAWQSYETVNAGFADAVLDELDRSPDATVWFHDYHLYLAPRLVRRARPDATMTHFVHIPWPEPDYWSVLPASMRGAIHDGLLANDVVGFHTCRWRDNFLASSAALLGAEIDGGGPAVRHQGRRTLATAHAIAVDPAEFDELAAAGPVLTAGRDLEGRSERLVLRVDRTDPSKNIVRGFEAFGLFLERHPEARGTVRMLALLDPSRQDIPQYAAYLDEILGAAQAVNERFGEDDRDPITVEVADDFPRSVAAYKHYDVLFVNAVFDGMNLIAKEAPLVNERDGVLVLSENAGAYEELARWAVTVNPFDVVGQAEAIHAALELPAHERRERAEAIRAHVREHDLEHWLAAQLAAVDRV